MGGRVRQVGRVPEAKVGLVRLLAHQWWARWWRCFLAPASGRAPVVVCVVEVVDVAVVPAAVWCVVHGAHAGVPLTCCKRLIPRGSKLGCQTSHVPWDRGETRHGVGAIGDCWVEVERVHVIRVPATLDGRPSRAAVLVDVRPVQVDTGANELIQIGSLDLIGARHELATRRGVVAMPPGVRPSVVIKEDKHKVRRLPATRLG
mmetsp:Transcript_13562/g.34905  ORF Transcript_13562/g.34905 Transcript_13562/m.34905 type:complete len:203 (-) Transcript_13562:112-720(-)